MLEVCCDRLIPVIKLFNKISGITVSMEFLLYKFWNTSSWKLFFLKSSRDIEMLFHKNIVILFWYSFTQNMSCNTKIRNGDISFFLFLSITWSSRFSITRDKYLHRLLDRSVLYLHCRVWLVYGFFYFYLLWCENRLQLFFWKWRSVACVQY